MDLAGLLVLLMFLTLFAWLLTGYPVAFVLAGTALVFGAVGIAAGIVESRDIEALPDRIFATMENELLLAVPLFIAMGVLLEKSRVAEDLLNSMGELFGNLRGGLGISVTIVGALLAASTGIVGATVVTMGLLSLPTMLKRGYDPALAAGAIAAAGTLGQIIPPSIVLILLADVLSSSYQLAQLQMGVEAPDGLGVGELFAGALLPGLLLVGFYIVYQVGVALFQPHKCPAAPGEGSLSDWATLARIFRALLPPLFLILAVLGSILGGIATPTEAASVGAVGALLIGAARRHPQSGRIMFWTLVGLVGLFVLAASTTLRLDRADTVTTDYILFGLAILATIGVFFGVLRALTLLFRDGTLMAAMNSTVRITTMVYAILIGAALFSLVFRGYGGDDLLAAVLSELPGGLYGAFAVVMIVMFLLGFFLDFIEITFVVVPIVAPALIMLGADPIWLGVMMAINLQTSFLTPPFGFALFYLRGVAPDSVRTTDIYRGAVPYVIIQILVLIVIVAFPALATWLPAQIF